jgi:hypothetical protein
LATLNWNDIREVTREEALASLLEILDSLDLTATAWQEGAVAPVATNIGADAREKLSAIAVFLRDYMHAETATGEALKRHSSGFYNIPFNPAVESQHLVTLECEDGEGPHLLNVGDVVLSHPDGHTFRLVEGNSVAFPYTLVGGTDKTFLFECEVAGSASNVGPGSGSTVTLELVTTLSGVSVTAHELDRSGVDEESDARLKERDQLQWSLLTQYELIDDAVKALCLAASPTILRVGLDTTNPRGPYTFNVYIGGLDSTSSDEDVGLAQVALQRRVRGGASIVRVIAATEVALDLTGTVYYSSSVAVAALQTAVEAALLDFIRAAPLGGYVYTPGPSNVIALNDIEAVIRGVAVNGVNPVRTVVLTSPTSNVAVPVYGLTVRGAWSLTYTTTAG